MQSERAAVRERETVRAHGTVRAVRRCVRERRREPTALRAPLAVSLLCLAFACAGCVSFVTVETTPEAMLETIRPADKVRVTLRDGSELMLSVRSVGDEFLRGRAVDASAAELVDVRLDRIAALEVERPNLKKAMLTILLPAVIGVAAICHNRGCESSSILIATP